MVKLWIAIQTNGSLNSNHIHNLNSTLTLLNKPTNYQLSEVITSAKDCIFCVTQNLSVCQSVSRITVKVVEELYIHLVDNKGLTDL